MVQKTSVLRNVHFIKLLVSQIMSLFAFSVANYILSLKLYSQTNSAYSVSMLWVIYSLPVVLVGPFASTLVDMTNRKTVLIITNILQAFTILAFIPIQDRFFLTYAIVFIYSLLNQFYLPAESAFVPELFKDNDLASANGIFFLSRQAAALLGFSAAGFLFKFLPMNFNLVLCAVMLVIAFFSVLTLPPSIITKRFSFETELGKFLTEVLEGYRYIKNNKSILYPLLFISGIQVFSTIAIINVPVIVKNLFKIPVEDGAVLVITPTLVGTLLGVYLFPKILGKYIRKKVLVENSLVCLFVCFVLLTFIPFVPVSLRVVFIPLVFGVIGAGFMGLFIPSQLYLQQYAPQEMMGRIYGNIWLLVTLATVVPLTLSASIAEMVGPMALMIIFAAFILFSRLYMPVLAKKLEFSYKG